MEAEEVRAEAIEAAKVEVTEEAVVAERTDSVAAQRWVAEAGATEVVAEVSKSCRFLNRVGPDNR